MSICQYVRMQLFSLVIKMKVVQNVKTISENIISVCQHVGCSQKVQPQKVQPHMVELSDNQKVQTELLNFLIIRKFNPYTYDIMTI